jgi:peptide deformylase
MAILEILEYPDPQLRKPCSEVKKIDKEILTLLNNMAETMYEAPGIGLAAAQVGAPHRVIVIDLGDNEELGREGKLYKLINPVIVDSSGRVPSEEGCLSIPDIRETIERYATVTVKALNEKSEEITIQAEGLLSYCLQHEIDHLNGVLFIDHLSRLKKTLVESKLKKLQSTE